MKNAHLIHLLQGTIFITFLTIFIGTAIEVYTSQQRASDLNVVLLTVESLRADMITEATTPQLLHAAREGISFTNHRAVSGWTGANIVSLLSGMSPFSAGVHTRGQSVAPGMTLPLHQLQERSYRTEGLQPFMTVDIYRNLGLQITESGLDPRLWMAEMTQEDQPFLLWYHYLKTHLPYSLNELPATEDDDQQNRLRKVSDQGTVHYHEATFIPKDIPLVRSMHSHAVREFDQWFGSFWSFYQQGGFPQNTILIVTADHGDEHGERGMVGHASTTLMGHLHEEVIRVPLFIWLPPELKQQPGSFTTISSHPDIMATLLPLLDIKPSRPLEGSNLLSGDTPAEWIGMTSSGGFSEPHPANIRYFEYGITDNNYKLLLRQYADGTEVSALYDVKSDPQELHDIQNDYPDISAALLEKLRKRIDRRTYTTSYSVNEAGGPTRQPPTWINPATSLTVGYDQFKQNSRLQWSGDPAATYQLEYTAGLGRKKLVGDLEVTGTVKEFSGISRYYWETWVAPNRLLKLRVRYSNDGLWSEPLLLELVK